MTDETPQPIPVSEPPDAQTRRARVPRVIRKATPKRKRAAKAAPIESIGPDGLTDKQRVWCEAYLQCGLNATEAARRAGYKDPEQSGWVNKNKAEIRAYLDARLKSHKMGADEVLARLSDMAQGNMGDFISREITEDGLSIDTIDLSKARKSGKLHLIRKIKIGPDGTSLELHDAKDALELIGKHYELFTEKQKIEGEVSTRISNLNELLKIAYGPKPTE